MGKSYTLATLLGSITYTDPDPFPDYSVQRWEQAVWAKRAELMQLAQSQPFFYAIYRDETTAGHAAEAMIGSVTDPKWHDLGVDVSNACPPSQFTWWRTGQELAHNPSDVYHLTVSKAQQMHAWAEQLDELQRQMAICTGMMMGDSSGKAIILLNPNFVISPVSETNPVNQATVKATPDAEIPRMVQGQMPAWFSSGGPRGDIAQRDKYLSYAVQYMKTAALYRDTWFAAHDQAASDVKYKAAADYYAAHKAEIDAQNEHAKLEWFNQLVQTEIIQPIAFVLNEPLPLIGMSDIQLIKNVGLPLAVAAATVATAGAAGALGIGALGTSIATGAVGTAGKAALGQSIGISDALPVASAVAKQLPIPTSTGDTKVGFLDDTFNKVASSLGSTSIGTIVSDAGSAISSGSSTSFPDLVKDGVSALGNVTPAQIAAGIQGSQSPAAQPSGNAPKNYPAAVKTATAGVGIGALALLAFFMLGEK